MERRLWMHKFKSGVRNEPLAQVLGLALVLTWGVMLQQSKTSPTLTAQTVEPRIGSARPVAQAGDVRTALLRRTGSELENLARTLGQATDCKPCLLGGTIKTLQTHVRTLQVELDQLTLEARLASASPRPDPISERPISSQENSEALELAAVAAEVATQQTDGAESSEKTKVFQSSSIDTGNVVE